MKPLDKQDSRSPQQSVKSASIWTGARYQRSSGPVAWKQTKHAGPVFAAIDKPPRRKKKRST